MSIVVAAWVGSPNLGDELVHAGLRLAATKAGIEQPLVPLSVDAARTARTHGGTAVAAHAPLAVLRALRGASAVLVGGGGILQDETSWFNLPYHLARPVLARGPVVGVFAGSTWIDQGCHRPQPLQGYAPRIGRLQGVIGPR